MTRALVTQLVDALEKLSDTEQTYVALDRADAVITAAREYLATEPSGERAELIGSLRRCRSPLGSMAADMLAADAREIDRLRSIAREAADAATELQRQVLVLKAQQGIKLRTEFEPKQRDHIEDSLGMVGERADLIADLRGLIDLHTWAHVVVSRAANMLEADAQPKQVTCQIYGHVVGACVECNTHIEAQQAKRVPLTAEHLRKLEDETDQASFTGNWSRHFARLIEAHHGIHASK